jgi:hypothetical protein
MRMMKDGGEVDEDRRAGAGGLIKVFKFVCKLPDSLHFEHEQAR